MIKTSPNERPVCPGCKMGMIVVKGFGFDRDVQTLECLRCGHLELPTSTRQPVRKAV
jgi:Zn ribbon nucleic-acid-binding protein